ncbi:MAG: TolC family protein [Bacteroidota bacterium]
MHKKLILVFNLLAMFLVTAQKRTYEIGFLLDRTSPEIDVLLDTLEEEITAVVGEDAILVFDKNNRLVNNFNSEKSVANYQALLSNDNIAIIIAFGLVNNSVVSRFEAYQKPTIVFGALSKELVRFNPTKTGVDNYTSITTSQSYKEDLRVLADLAKPKRVGIIIETGFVNNIDIANIFSDIGKELEFETSIIPFEDLDDITTNLENIDAVYLAGGYYLTNEEIEQLAEVLIQKRLPSFTANPIEDVENGILATNHDKSDIDQFFRRIALTVESVVNGEELDSLGTVIESESSLSINFNTANKIGLPLRYSLINSTNFIGNPDEQTSDKIYNLYSVMQEAIIENLELETFRQDVELINKDWQIAKSDYLPDLSANAVGNLNDPDIAEISFGQSPEFQTLGNVTLSQLVFSNDANANITIQAALRDAQKENYNSEELNTIFNSAQAYFNALILKANLSIQSKNLELTKLNLKIAEENFDAGQTGKSDVLRFRSELTQNTQDLIEAINQLQEGFYELNFILNNPIDSKIDVEEAELMSGVFENYNYEQIGAFLDDPTLKDPFVKFLIQEAKLNSPELKSLDFNILATERSERLFGAGRFLPTVSLEGQYNYEFTRSGAGSEFTSGLVVPQGYYGASVNVTLPIFNQNKQNLNQQIAAIQTEQLNVDKANFELSLDRNVNNAVLQIINQIANIELSRVFEETAEETLDLTQTSYANGAVNIVQLLDAQNNYLQAQQASANATYNYLLSALQLERFLGSFFLLQTEQEKLQFMERFLEFTQQNND